MKNCILELRIELDSFPQPIEGHDAFLSLAEEEGLHVQTIKVSTGVGEPFDKEAIHDAIRQAQGFWIRHFHLLDDEEIRAIVESRLAAGAVAFAEVRGKH